MFARRLGQEYIGQDRRDAIIQGIAEARGIAAGLDQRAAGFAPNLLDPTGPMKADAANYTKNRELRARLEPAVTALVQRLNGPGPRWPWGAEDQKTVENYIGAIDAQAALMDRYFPSELRQDAQKIALLAIGFGALFSPLLWETGEKWSFSLPRWVSVPPTEGTRMRNLPLLPSGREYAAPRPGTPFPRPAWTPPSAEEGRSIPMRTGPSTFRSPSHGTFSIRRPT